ncbi:MAG TPA: right-handed parallel beta-helix repeat-containing protein [bacterium]|nr:right-handed parallel beta-helix repeat-containing protein [bacterium]
MSKLRMMLLVGIAALLFCGMASAGEFYVDAEAGSDSNSGTSADSAWLTISHALSSVLSSQGDPATVHIAAGTYSASTNGETFPLEMRSYVSLVGASAETTILDAEGAAYHVILATFVRDVSIECTTIKGGNATGVYENGSGGGVFCTSVLNITMRSCTVTENAAVIGAGIVLGQCSGLVTDCDFVSNTAQGIPESDGIGLAGGVLCTLSEVRFENCSVRENQALAGTGAYADAMAAGVCLMDISQRSRSERSSFLSADGATATLVGCSVLDNICVGEHSLGGGIACIAESIVFAPAIVDCTISGNTAWSGGGICCAGQSSPTILDCTISRNVCPLGTDGSSYGGGIECDDSSPTIVGCQIMHNSANYGGGIECYDLAAPTIEDCIIEDNTAPPDMDGDSRGGGVWGYRALPTIVSCSVARNSAYLGAGVYLSVSRGSIENCLVADNVGTQDANGQSWGGGMYLSDSSTSINSCTISGNSAYAGAGIRCKGTPSCEIIECTIADNIASPDPDGDSWGAGINCYESSPEIRGCTVSGNSASHGAGIRCSSGSSPEIVNCRIVNNEAVFAADDKSWGGGIGSGGSAPFIDNCTILRNSAWAGAGISSDEDLSTSIRNCTISNNIAAPNSGGNSYGGGIWCYDSSPVIANCLIHDNYAVRGGGVRACNSLSNLTNCTISANLADGGGALYCTDSSSLTITDSVVWDNGDEFWVEALSSVNLTYSCIQGGYTGVGNISEAPLFVSGPLGDYYLSCEAAGQGANSPCMDAGSDTAEALGLDELTTRTDCGPDAGVADMGYHYPLTSGEAPVIECSLNAAEFWPGDQLVAMYDIDNPGPDITVDVYFAFVFPDGAILCISPDRIAFGIFPYMMGLFLEQGYSMEPETLVDIAVPGGLPGGGYLFAAALSSPERFEVIGDLSLFAFSMR